MCKAGNLEPCDLNLKEKMAYEKFMQMDPKQKTPYMEQPYEKVPIGSDRER